MITMPVPEEASLIQQFEVWTSRSNQEGIERLYLK